MGCNANVLSMQGDREGNKLKGALLLRILLPYSSVPLDLMIPSSLTSLASQSLNVVVVRSSF